MKLTAGSGRKTIRLRFAAMVSDSGTWTFTPYYPLSPTYKKTLTLALSFLRDAVRP